MRVDVGLAAEILDEVDDDLDAAGFGDLELLGPDAEGDLRQTRLAELGQVVALEFAASSHRS